MSFLPLTSLEDLKDKDRHFIKKDGEAILLVKQNEEWKAFDGRCPHAKAILSHAEIEEGVLECPFHGWKFSLENGKCTFPDGAPSLREYELKFVKDEVLIKY